jgi:hypothetical protein
MSNNLYGTKVNYNLKNSLGEGFHIDDFAETYFSTGQFQLALYSKYLHQLGHLLIGLTRLVLRIVGYDSEIV